MTVAIENFIQLQGLNKILILGDMFELGSESKRASANCRFPVERKAYNVSFYWYCVLLK
jgi:UDP-N-acetylmuramyl pentapeptide synthase